MPNRARKARANVAADENPWSSATSSTLWSGCAVRATAARSILSRWMKPNSVSPVVALKTRWKLEGREGGDARQAREGELLGEMSTNMIDDAVDPLLVLDPVRAGHGSKNLR